MATAFLPVLGRGFVRTRRCLPSTAAISSSRTASGTLPTMVAPVPGSKIDLSASVMTLIDGKPAALPLKDVFAGKKVVLFSLPGALTPTCTDSQGPEFVDAAEDFAAKGVDTIACLTVNDPFVTSVFAKKLGAVDKITFLADGNAAVTKALGLDFDTGGFGGVRAVRGSYIVDDGVFSHVNVEAGGAFEGPGSAETVLKQL
jgi:glutaredoxin/glutathione-dependent peroxiredoxin